MIKRGFPLAKCVIGGVSCVIVLLLLYSVVVVGVSRESVVVEIGGRQIQAEVARTDTERQQGLSGRRELCASCGMLFVFDQPSQYHFWMKDMELDIDFIMINNGKIVDMVPHVRHDRGQEEVVATKHPFDAVLELNSGYIEKNGIQIGDSVTYPQVHFE